jgi:hypothetical protein
LSSAMLARRELQNTVLYIQDSTEARQDAERWFSVSGLRKWSRGPDSKKGTGAGGFDVRRVADQESITQ